MVEKMKTLMKQIATDPKVSDEQLLENAASKIQSHACEDGKINTRNKLKRDLDASSHESTQIRNNDQTLTPSQNISTPHNIDEMKSEAQEGTSDKNRNCQLSSNEPNEMSLINEQKLENDNNVREISENDPLADAGSVEEDDLGSLLHGVNLNSLVREFEMEAACVAAAAAEAVEGECNEVVGDVRDTVCEEEVSNLGGFLELTDDCNEVTSNSRGDKNQE